MVKEKYEIIEKDQETQDTILSTLIENPTQGVAYICLRSSGPMSAADIIEYLALSDTWFTEKFDDAVGELAEKGLIRQVANE